MKKIELYVEDNNLQTVRTILENLKSGLIESIVYDDKKSLKIDSKYKPKLNQVTYEQESGTNDRQGKYLSTNAYKQRLKKL